MSKHKKKVPARDSEAYSRKTSKNAHKEHDVDHVCTMRKT